MLSGIGVKTPTLNVPPARPAAPPPAVAPTDQAEVSSPVAKVLYIPRLIIEGVAGSIGAVVGAVLKTAPGAVEGLAHGVQYEPKPKDPWNQGSTGWYTVTSLAESMAAGAGIGALAGGPIGAAIGTGAGFMAGVVGRVIETKGDVARSFVSNVDSRVDSFLAVNTDGTKTKIAFQNAVEGTIVGARSGFRQGLNLGWDAGKGAVSGFLNVTEGALEGAYEGIKDLLRG
ncbi:MAG: hypothetical protein ACYCW6_25745 [Candidatus Xenobia bacterium]